jgi:hypothetical protein
VEAEEMNVVAGLWAADPHQFGPGKVHLVDAEDEERTLCGKWLKAMPGKRTDSGTGTCKICLNAVETRAHNKLREEQRQRQREQFEHERADQNRQWWQRYNAYLASPEWKAKRAKVLARASGGCEACANAAATEVHHITYAHVFDEPLFDLRAVCRPCHERLTKRDRENRERRGW